MGIGADIGDVLSEIGSAFTIIRDSGDITGEYGELTINEQITKPWVYTFHKELALQYDTQVVPGDILEFETTGDRYLLMAVNFEEFENEIIAQRGIVYKANVSGEILRPSGEAWSSQTYHKEQQFELIKENCYALETESLFGHDLETDQELGMLGIKEDELYIPSSANIQVNDRYQPVSGEYYRVEVIKKRRFFGIDVCEIGEDHR